MGLFDFFRKNASKLSFDEAATKLIKLVNGSLMQNIRWVGEIKEFIPYSEQQRDCLIQEIYPLRLASILVINKERLNGNPELEEMLLDKLEEMLTAFNEHDKSLNVNYVLENYYEHIQEYLEVYNENLDQDFNLILGKLTKTYFSNIGIDILKASQEVDGFSEHYCKVRDIIGEQIMMMTKKGEEIIDRIEG